MTLIPSFIRRLIVHRPNLVKIVDNIGWLFFDRILRMGVGLFVGVWIARYLGPEQFGVLSFVTVFVSLFSTIALLGLPGIVVRDIVNSPEGVCETLGTAAVLQLVGGFMSYLLLLAVIAYLRPNDDLIRTIVAIMGSMMLFKASDIAVYWCESQVLSKYTVWVQNSAFLIFVVIKVALIFQAAPLKAFVWAMLGEAAVVAVILLYVLGKYGLPLSSLYPTSSRAKTLLKDSWPLILSAFAVTIYMKIDQIMLGEMIGDEAVGIYAAATRISEVWYFIPMAIVTSVFPAILETKKHSEAHYYARLQKLYDLMVVISVPVALLMMFLSAPIVNLLFGAAYQSSSVILAIHIWGSIFVFLGVASDKWFNAENYQILSLQKTVLGALSNVALNLWLIPVYGEVGAAWATVISYAIAAFISDLMYKKTRQMFFMKLSAFNPLAVCQRFL
jgi:O-antigen/teichoic acid export membrane protein